MYLSHNIPSALKGLRLQYGQENLVSVDQIKVGSIVIVCGCPQKNHTVQSNPFYSIEHV